MRGCTVSSGIPFRPWLLLLPLILVGCGGSSSDDDDAVTDNENPVISCVSPADGAIIDQAPGDLVSVSGSVSDLSNLVDVKVNGASVVLDSSDNFVTDVTGAWGINFVEISATDAVGRQSQRVCSFLLADTWVLDNQILDSGVSLNARSAAFDDSNRFDPLDSIADFMHTVFNSSGLSSEIHNALLAANPLKPDSCDQTTLFDVCILRSHVRYLNLSLPGPNTTVLPLIANGVSNFTRIEDLGVRVRVDGHVAGIPYDTTGWVTFDFVTVSLNSQVALSAGLPSNNILPGSVSTSVGAVSTSFSGLDGGIINIVSSLFNGAVRNLVRDLVRAYVIDNLDAILDDLFAQLDIHNLAAVVGVPSLDGSGTVDVSFSTEFSSLQINTMRMLTSFGTLFSSTATHLKPTLGAPIEPGNRLFEAATSRSMAAAVHTGVINQALHALWHGGYFDTTLAGGSLGGIVPPNVTLRFDAILTPVASLRNDGRIEIAIGAVETKIDHPGLLSSQLDAMVGGRGSCELSLLGDDLVLDNCLIDDLHLSTPGSELDAGTQGSLELLLTDVINEILARSLNDVFPAFPLPGFVIPASLGSFGLPAGDELGITSPVLNIQNVHLVLDGNLGVD